MNKPFTVLALTKSRAEDPLFARLTAIGGYLITFETAESEPEAVERLKAAPMIDLLLIDCPRTWQDALSWLQQLNSEDLSRPTIVLLQEIEPEGANALLDAGVSECLVRPGLSPDILWRASRSAVQLRRAQDNISRERVQREQALRRNEERLRFLYNTTSSPDLSFDQKLDRLLQQGCREFGMESGFLARLTDDTFEVIRSHPAGETLPAGYKCPVGDTYCIEALHHPDAFSIVHAAESEWKSHRAYTIFHRESYLGAIVWTNGHKFGTLAFTSSQPRDVMFDAGDKEFIRLMAQWIGGEMDRSLAEEDLRRSERRYRSLTDATAQIVWTTSPSGEFVTEQAAWSELTGQSVAESLGWGWLTAIHPEDQWQTAEAWQDALRRVQTYRIQHRVRRRDSIYRTFSVRAVPVVEDDGSIQEWVGVHTDITERTEAEERLEMLAEASTLLSSSLEYEQTLAGVAQAVVPRLADWCVVYLTQDDGTIRNIVTAHDDPQQLAAAKAWQASHTVDMNATRGTANVIRTGKPELVSEITDDMLTASLQDPEALALIRSLGIRSYLCVPMTARGQTLGAITMIASHGSRRYTEADLDLAQDIGRRAATAVDNARLYEEVSARAQREERVNKIGRVLRSTLDPDEVIRIATREVGVALGVSRCALSMINPQQNAFQTAVPQFTAPGVMPKVAQYPLSVYPKEYLAAWQAGDVVLVRDTRADPQDEFIEHLWPESGALRALIACPISLRGQWAGLLTVQQNAAPRNWTPDEVSLLEAVADILALALENARLYTREHRVADNLQAAFLPNITEELADLELAITYSSGLEEAQVGGDLYDAFPLADGRVALIIADVSGKGLGAAVQTATVKYSLRAFAAEAASPGLVIRRLNRTLCSEASGLGEHFVTLFYGVYDPHTGRLIYVSAGHETQMIKRANGGVTLLHANGPILGIAEHHYEQEVNHLHPGDSLVLFTDGLTEARQSGTRELLELDRIHQAVSKIDADYGPGAIVTLLEKLAMDWTAGKPQDDLALLVAKRATPDAVSSSDIGQLPPSEEQLFGFAFPSSPEYAAEVRQAVAHWMDLLGFNLVEIEDFQTAVTEAVTNAVRHGSPQGSEDSFFITGYRTGPDTFSVEISDSGPGLPTSNETSEMPDPDAPGGRGVPMIYALSDEVAFLPADRGLRLRMVKFASEPRKGTSLLTPAGDH